MIIRLGHAGVVNHFVDGFVYTRLKKKERKCLNKLTETIKMKIINYCNIPTTIHNLKLITKERTKTTTTDTVTILPPLHPSPPPPIPCNYVKVTNMGFF